jgi:uncharacterized membrane protein
MVRWLGRLGFVVVILLALVGINSVVGRFIATVDYLATDTKMDLPELPEMRGFNDRYYANPYLTLAHVTTGFLFMTLGPLQFVPAIRNRWMGFHRWCGRVFLLASLVGLVTAVAFVPLLPVWGSFSTRVGVIVASTLFAISLVQGYRNILRRNIAKHREWMIRLFAIGLGISTFRVLIPLLMLPPIAVSFNEAWDTVVWLGFVINIGVAEWWINLTRPSAALRHVPASRIHMTPSPAEIASTLPAGN